MTRTDACTGAQLAEEVMFKRSQVAALNDILAKVNSMQKTVRANFLFSFFCTGLTQQRYLAAGRWRR
jgi:hypothetical protein